MSQKQTTPTHDMESQGWVRQFMIETDRVAEYIELYESLGDEVRIEPLPPDLMEAEECSTCYLARCDKYVIIYTRSRK